MLACCYAKMSSKDEPRVLSSNIVYRTPWFDLVAKEGVGFAQPYYVLRTTDYVTIVPITTEGMVVFIRQYRPALEAYTLELPGGHRDAGEVPEETARRELREETGYTAMELASLGSVSPDTGRMDNQLWTFVARVRQIAPPERGVELQPRSVGDVGRMVREGELRHALDIAALTKAALAGHLPALG